MRGAAIVTQQRMRMEYLERMRKDAEGLALDAVGKMVKVQRRLPRWAAMGFGVGVLVAAMFAGLGVWLHLWQ